MTSDAPVPFVLLAAERTGSNLLLGMLQSHPDVIAGGELFNMRLVQQGRVDWPELSERETAEFAELRGREPAALVDRILGNAAERGAKAAGFKLMYSHLQGFPAVVERLAADPAVRMIHLERRNLLARFVSNEQARVTDRWAAKAGGESKPMPAIEVEFDKFIHNLLWVEQVQRDLAERFDGHPSHELWYEDLADDPVAVGREVAAFLGLDTAHPLAVRYRKTGTKRMRDAVTNYAEVRERLARWVSYFDD